MATQYYPIQPKTVVNTHTTGGKKKYVCVSAFAQPQPPIIKDATIIDMTQNISNMNSNIHSYEFRNYSTIIPIPKTYNTDENENITDENKKYENKKYFNIV